MYQLTNGISVTQYENIHTAVATPQEKYTSKFPEKIIDKQQILKYVLLYTHRPFRFSMIIDAVQNCVQLFLYDIVLSKKVARMSLFFLFHYTAENLQPLYYIISDFLQAAPSIHRYGLRGRELLNNVGKVMLQSGGTFGTFMSIGAGIRC